MFLSLHTHAWIWGIDQLEAPVFHYWHVAISSFMKIDCEDLSFMAKR